MTDKILIDRSVVEQAVKALDLSYALLESAKSMHYPAVLDAYKAIRAALDAKPVEQDDLVQRLNTEPTASQFLKAGDLFDLLIAERKEAATRIESLTQKAQADASDWSRFHNLMKKYGLHPGRTDDDLIEILDRDMDASKVGLHHIRENNVKLRERITELEKSLDAAKWALDIASDNTGYQSESDREANHEINSALKKIDEIRKCHWDVRHD